MLCPWKARTFVFPRQTARAQCAGASRSCRSQSQRAPRHRRAQAGAAREIAQDADDRESVCNLRVYPGEALPEPARTGGGAQEQSNLSTRSRTLRGREHLAPDRCLEDINAPCRVLRTTELSETCRRFTWGNKNYRRPQCHARNASELPFLAFAASPCSRGSTWASRGPPWNPG